MAKVRKLADVRGLFPNHSVLAVNGQTVALLDMEGRPCTYTFQDDEKTVVPERIVEVAVNSVFGGGDSAVSVPVEQLIGEVQARLNATKAALDKATEENTDLTAKIKEMTEAEHKRRVELVKNAIKAKLDYMRQNSGCEIDEHLCDDMLTDDCLNGYAEKVDGEGNFCGDKEAEEKVGARCAEKICDAHKARQNAQRTRYAWELGEEDSGANEPKNGIEKVLNKYAAKKN